MGNSICYGGQRGLSERDENLPGATEAAGSPAANNAQAAEVPQAPGEQAAGQASEQPHREGGNGDEEESFEVTASEEAGALNMAWVLTRTSPSASVPARPSLPTSARQSAADAHSNSASQQSLMITTIHMLPAPAFEQRNMILQTPEEMMEDVQILGIIGAGAFAVVYRGVYQGGDAAIKLVTIDPQKGGWSEAFVAPQLRHPHVVNTYTARGARLTQEFFDRVWSAPPPSTRPPLPPRDALPALPSEDGLGNPRKTMHERQGWRDVLARVGASPDKGLLMLVQEHCDKGNLAGAIKRGLFSTSAHEGPRERILAHRMLLRTATEICRGMMHMHKASVVHGDLKPANVLLQSSNADRRGFITKIADFGLARMLQKDASYVESDTTGTAPYMSPESFSGVHSKAGDVYAFGMVLWEMMTGLKPYDGKTVGQIMVGVISKSHPLRPNWPEAEWPALCELGRRCLDGEPAKRPTFKELEGQLVALEEAIRESGRRESEDVQPPLSFTLPPIAAAGHGNGPSTSTPSGGGGGGGGCSMVANSSPPGSPRVRHRLAIASVGDTGAGGGDGGVAGGADYAGSGGTGVVASPSKRGSLELRRAAAAAASAASVAAAASAAPQPVPQPSAAAESNAAAAESAAAGAADAAVAAALTSAASAASEPISPWATAMATQASFAPDIEGGFGI